MMLWMLIISAYGYAGNPVVSVQTFPTELVCKAAMQELQKHEFSGLMANEPKYECVKLDGKAEPKREEKARGDAD